MTHLALGGAERVAINLCEALRPDFDFGVYAVRGLGDGEVGRSLRRELRRMNVPLFTGPRVPMKCGGMVPGAIKLRWAVWRFQPTLIHLHTEIPEVSCATMLAVAPGLRSIPLVRTIHNSIYWQSWRSVGRWTDRLLEHSQIASVSKGAMLAYLQLRRDSQAAEPSLGARTIYNGVPFTDTPPIRPAPAAPDVVRVVFGGRLEHEKGADLLPEIIARTPLPPHRRAELTIFGSGRYRSALERLARHPPAGWTIRVRQPTSSFRRQLTDFDLVLVPSRFEGLCLVAIEAFLSGLPVIATTAPGLSETVPAGYPWAARVGDAGDLAAILGQALASPDRWPDVAAMGRQFALQRFSAASMAAAYRALYLGALGGPVPAYPPAAAGVVALP